MGVTPGCPVAVFDLSFFNITQIKAGAPNFEGDRPYYQIETLPFSSCVLKYTYLRPRRYNPAQNFWLSMGWRLENLTLIEIMKPPDDEKPISESPENLGSFFASARRIIRQPPAGWTFWDDHVVQWLEAFQRSPQIDRETLWGLG
ncbi:hypothetical protein BGZ60DRAFT_524346 [Tricladium varicosporioides]|nr:hypothetical protein BGZ60DRAFT_524346 [Hymenoscyphus varicosporioides]